MKPVSLWSSEIRAQVSFCSGTETFFLLLSWDCEKLLPCLTDFKCRLFTRLNTVQTNSHLQSSLWNVVSLRNTSVPDEKEKKTRRVSVSLNLDVTESSGNIQFYFLNIAKWALVTSRCRDFTFIDFYKNKLNCCEYLSLLNKMHSPALTEYKCVAMVILAGTFKWNIKSIFRWKHEVKPASAHMK